MKKIFTLILALFMILNIQGQNNSTENQIASAIIGGIVAGAAASVAYNQYEERVELIATNYILDNYPEYKNFYLSLSNHSKANDYWDPSSVKVNAFTFENYKLDSQLEKKVLLMFNDYGWINEYGIDLNLVTYRFVDKDEWNDIVLEYLSLASGKDVANTFYEKERVMKSSSKRKFENINPNEKNVSPIENASSNVVGYEVTNMDTKYTLSDIEILKNRVVLRQKKSVFLMTLDFKGGDLYRVSDYSDEFKIIHNESKLGLFLKENKELVQLSLNAVNRITAYLNN